MLLSSLLHVLVGDGIAKVSEIAKFYGPGSWNALSAEQRSTSPSRVLFLACDGRRRGDPNAALRDA